MFRNLFFVAVLALAGLTSPSFSRAAPATSADDTKTVQVAWRLLDYVAVDYPGAVQNGKVVSDAEYAEMVEFAATVEKQITSLEDRPEKAQLLTGTLSLKAAIADKATPERIARDAQALAGALLSAYPVQLAPTAVPDVLSAQRIYDATCASCHGSTGDGKGSAAIGLDPPPIAFRDLGRARERSVFGLYQVIGQGLDGTSMPSFAHLPEQQRWALAFYVGGFAFEDRIKAGEKIWKSEPEVRALVPDLAALVSLTPTALSKRIGEEKALNVTAYLRSNPAAVLSAASPIAISRKRLREADEAYRIGKKQDAEKLALSAYLDGFETVEPLLAARDNALLTRVEKEMIAVRSAIAAREPAVSVSAKVATVVASLDEVERVLSDDQSTATSTFVGAFTILLREGLEALLIVAAMIAFLRKADRTDALPWVHGGWIAALAAGVATWAAATYLISVSGASRELTEGFGAVLATVVLLWVGIWLHGKSQADEWQKFIHQTMSKALSKGSLWFLFGLSFLVVYREVFETILFFSALWNPETAMALFAGAGVAAGVLFAVGWVMLRYSQRLPIGKFFAYSSILISALAVVLAGKGVAALQEAGLLPLTPLPLPKIELFGIYPTIESIAAQAVVLGIVLFAFRAKPLAEKN